MTFVCIVVIQANFWLIHHFGKSTKSCPCCSPSFFEYYKKEVKSGKKVEGLPTTISFSYFFQLLLNRIFVCFLWHFLSYTVNPRLSVAVLFRGRRLFKQRPKVSDERFFLSKRIDISTSSSLFPSSSESNSWSGSYTLSLSDSLAWNGSISGFLKIYNLCLTNVSIKRRITTNMRGLFKSGA